MAKTITLANLDTYFQDRLKNTVGSPLEQVERVRILNQTIQMLQGMANWDPTRRVVTWDYLNQEAEYAINADLGVTDFKDVAEIRDPNEAYTRFDPVDEKTMSELIAEGNTSNAYNVEERDNTDILRVIYSNGNTRTVIGALDSLSESGTWSSDTTTSDATTLAADTTRMKEGGGSLKFNISVSQSSNNKAAIKNTTLTAIDLTDYENIGHFRAWVDLQQLTAAQLATISNVEIRFGSDTSNYWAITATGTITGGTFKAGWNRVNWDWADATKTASPDVAAIDYVELIINYTASMTSANNIRWDELVVILPRELEFVYFSDFMVKDGSTWQAEFSIDTVDTTEELQLPTRYRDAFLHLAAVYGFRQMKGEDSQEYLFHQMKGDKLYRYMFKEIGHDIVKELSNVLVRGASHGRTEGHLQW